LGVLWEPAPSFRVGSFYSLWNADASPGMGLLKLGASWSGPLLDRAPALLLIDVSMPPYGVYAVQLGAEQAVFSNFFVRLGFQEEYSDNDIPGFRGLTAGLGVKLKDLELDYSYAPDGDLGSSQMVGLTCLFPQAPPPPVPPPVPQVSFKPGVQLSPADKVSKVEIQFRLPEVAGNVPDIPLSPGLLEAIKAGGEKVGKNPSNFQAWIALGNLYWESGQPDYALQCFEEALQLQPLNKALKNWLKQYKSLHPGK